MGRPEKNEFIQLLRFVAAFLVLVTHATFYYAERVDPSMAVWHVGEIGVPIFFVVSGFVMASLHGTEHGLPAARGFAVKRLIRILPLYWLATGLKIAVAVLAPAAVNHNHFEAGYALKSLLLIPTFNGDGQVRPIHGVGWTLYHEMFFYALFAAAILAARGVMTLLPAIIVGLCVWGAVAPPHTALGVVLTSPVNLYFVVGMFVGAAHAAGGRTAGLLCAALLVLAGAKAAAPELMRAVPLDAAVLALAGASLPLMSIALPGPLAGLATLGGSSYALYLLHPFLIPAALVVLSKGPFVALPGALRTAAGILVSVAVAEFVHRRVEIPLTARLRERFPTAAPRAAR